MNNSISNVDSSNGIGLTDRYGSTNIGTNNSSPLFTPTNKNHTSPYMNEPAISAYKFRDETDSTNVRVPGNVLLTEEQQRNYQDRNVSINQVANITNSSAITNKNIYLPDSTDGELIFN